MRDTNIFNDQKRYKLKKGNDLKILTTDDLVFFLTNNNNNYVFVAEGGVGKSWVANELCTGKGGLIDAKTLNFNEIKHGCIIDSIDEINVDKATKIFDYISSNKITGIKIFSRPETFNFVSPFKFIKIEIYNTSDLNPRYYQFENNEEPLVGFGNFVNNTNLNFDQIDFLSFLAFKLGINGEVMMSKNYFNEFARIYNVNNNTKINIVSILETNDILGCNDVNIWFSNKSLLSYFVYCFLTKFTFTKNNYLMRFSTYASQYAFSEVAVFMAKSSDEKIKKQIIELIFDKGFYFMFLNNYPDDESLYDYMKIRSMSIDTNTFELELSRMIMRINLDPDYNHQILISFENNFFHKIIFKEFINKIYNSIPKNNKEKFIFSILCSVGRFLSLNTSDEKDFVIISDVLTDKLKLLNSCETKYNNVSKRYMVRMWPFFPPKNTDWVNAEYYQRYSGPIETTYILCDKFVEDDELKRFVNWTTKNNLHMSYNKEEKYSRVLNLFVDDISKGKMNIGFFHILSEQSIEITSQIVKRFEHDEMFFNTLIDYKENAKRTKRPMISRDIHNNLNPRLIRSFQSHMRIVQPNVVNKIDKCQIRQSFYNMQIPKILMTSCALNQLVIFELGQLQEITIFYIMELINEIKIKFDVLESVIDLKTYDALLQLASCSKQWEKIKYTDIHPIVLASIHFISKNYHSKDGWWMNFDNSNVEKYVVNHFSNIDKFIRIIDSDFSYIFNDNINHILHKMNHNDVEKALSFLMKKTCDGKWDESLATFYDDYPSVKQYVSNLNFDIKNAYDLIESKSTKLAIKGKLINSEQMMQYFTEMFKNEHMIMKENGIYTYMWHMYFFEINGSDDSLWWRLFDYLDNFGLAKKALEFMKTRFIAMMNELKTKDVVNIMLHKLILASKWSGDFFMFENWLRDIKDKTNAEMYSYIEEVWMIYTKRFLKVKAVKHHFNLLHYFETMNKNLSVVEVIPTIIEKLKNDSQKIFKKIFINNDTEKLETRIHKQMNQELPTKYLYEFGVTYLSESNPFVPLDKQKSVDIMLEYNKHYICIELKSSLDSRLTNVQKQLQTYSNNQTIQTENFLFVFVCHELGSEKKNKIIDSANIANYKTIFIEVS